MVIDFSEYLKQFHAYARQLRGKIDNTNKGTLLNYLSEYITGLSHRTYINNETFQSQTKSLREHTVRGNI